MDPPPFERRIIPPHPHKESLTRYNKKCLFLTGVLLLQWHVMGTQRLYVHTKVCLEVERCLKVFHVQLQLSRNVVAVGG